MTRLVIQRAFFKLDNTPSSRRVPRAPWPLPLRVQFAFGLDQPLRQSRFRPTHRSRATNAARPNASVCTPRRVGPVPRSGTVSVCSVEQVIWTGCSSRQVAAGSRVQQQLPNGCFRDHALSGERVAAPRGAPAPLEKLRRSAPQHLERRRHVAGCGPAALAFPPPLRQRRVELAPAARRACLGRSGCRHFDDRAPDLGEAPDRRSRSGRGRCSPQP